ncbi:MAG: hypothetical protein IJ572_00200 [Bacilli bacterium]|nr:hypothetical protein [Bacilli bacterium]
MDNNSIMEVLHKYDNLKDLSYENNILSYNGQSINISNIKLLDFFSNSYSQMYIDQHTISAQDFFLILSIHSKKIEDDDVKNEEEKKFDVINVNHYFNILKNEIISKNDKLYVAGFESYISSLIEYQDYLLKDCKSFLDDYTKRIIILNSLEEQSYIEGENFEYQLSENEKNAISKFYEISEYVRNKTNDITRKLIRKNEDVSSGYINAFIVILTLIVSGISIAISIFFMIKK